MLKKWEHAWVEQFRPLADRYGLELRPRYHGEFDIGTVGLVRPTCACVIAHYWQEATVDCRLRLPIPPETCLGPKESTWELHIDRLVSLRGGSFQPLPSLYSVSQLRQFRLPPLEQALCEYADDLLSGDNRSVPELLSICRDQARSLDRTICHFTRSAAERFSFLVDEYGFDQPAVEQHDRGRGAMLGDISGLSACVSYTGARSTVDILLHGGSWIPIYVLLDRRWPIVGAWPFWAFRNAQLAQEQYEAHQKRDGLRTIVDPEDVDEMLASYEKCLRAVALDAMTRRFSRRRRMRRRLAEEFPGFTQQEQKYA